MPRPQLAIGDYGSISYTTTPDGQHVAMARFRDADGETRRVRAQGRSKGAATAALKAKFKERASEGDLSSESLVADLAERYWVMKSGDNLAAGTLYNLRRGIDNHIIPRMGKLRVREATAQRLHRVVDDITRECGPGTAQVVRSAMSGMFAAAVRWGAASANPVVFTPVPKMVKKEIRALTVPELLLMRAHAVEALRPVSAVERLARAGGDSRRIAGADKSPGLLDVLDFLLATGCRAAEVPGLAWEDVHLDDPVPWVKIRQQVNREIGVGLRLTPTKEHDIRNLRLPVFAIEMLRRRQAEAKWPMVFPSARGGLWSNVSIAGSWREIFRGSDWEWVTQKTLRKTVATLVDAQHGSLLASQQLGHASDSTTRAHYIAKSLVPVDAGQALELFERGA